MATKLASKQAAITSKSTKGRPAGALDPRVILHEPGHRGPGHHKYPAINVRKTAEAFGISKSQLSRLLGGRHKPSMASLGILSAILRKPVEEVMEMYQGSQGNQSKTKETKKERK